MKTISFDDVNNINNKQCKRKRNTFILMSKSTRLEIFNRLFITKGVDKSGTLGYYNKLRNTYIEEPINYDIIASNLGMTHELLMSYIEAYCRLHPSYKNKKLKVINKVYNKLCRDLRYLTYTEGDIDGFYNKESSTIFSIEGSENDFKSYSIPTILNLSKDELRSKFVYINYNDVDIDCTSKFSNLFDVIPIKNILRDKSILGIPLNQTRIDELGRLYKIILMDPHNSKTITECLNNISDILGVTSIYILRYIRCTHLGDETILITDDDVKEVISEYNIEDCTFKACETILFSGSVNSRDTVVKSMKLNLDIKDIKSGVYPVDKYIVVDTYTYPLPYLKHETINKMFKFNKHLKEYMYRKKVLRK